MLSSHTLMVYYSYVYAARTPHTTMPWPVFTPSASSPQYSSLDVIPTTVRTVTAAIFSVHLAVLICTLQRLPEVYTDCTSALVSTFIPAFLRLRSNCLDISSS